MSDQKADTATGKTRDRGLFIVFEGGEGAGKTTQAELLTKWLESLGHTVLQTREPGGTELGKEIRELLLHGGQVDPRAETLLYAADRAQHINTLVKPALDRGETVVQDRYIDSSIAYQSGARGFDAAEIAGFSAWATGGLLPDLVILHDIDPLDGASRREQRGAAADRLERESLEFHRRVRETFLQRAGQDPQRYLVIDAMQTREAIAEQIRERVTQLLQR